MSQILVTGEAKIRDIQGPVVSNSGVITALDGDASQYVRGDGTLADFPTSTGGGSSVSYYLNSSVSQGTIGGVAYRQLSKTPISGAGTDIAISTTGYVASYITDANDPALLEVPAGNFNCEFYFSVNSNSHNPYVYAELYKYDGTTFTLLGSNVAIPEYLTNGTTLSAYYFAIPVAVAALTITDRLAIRIYVNVDGRVVTLHTENSHLCQVVTTFSKGLISLNNLTRQNQFFGTGTSGTDFAISSSVATHTFNLPVASAANTGKLSSTDWSTFNNKVPYTGATTDVNLGAFGLTASLVYAHNIVATKSGISSGGLAIEQATGSGVPATGISLISSSGNFFELKTTTGIANTKLANIDLSGLTNNTTRTFTLPDVSGQIAILESPFQVFTGTVQIQGQFNTLYGISMQKGSTPPSFSFADVFIYAASGTANILKIANNTYESTLSFPTSNQTYTFPASTGTIALLEGTQTFSGSKTFSANPSINAGGQSSLSILSSTGNSALILGYVNNILKGTIDISATEFKLISAIDNILKFQSSTNFRASLIFSNSADYSYTYPAASGTIALTSNLSSYVPYTGATANVDLGGNSLYFNNGQAIFGRNFAGSTAYALIGVNPSNKVSIDTSALGVVFGGTIGNGTYTYTLPSATGTLALTSDISYPVTSVFGRTGAVVATEGDYSLTQLSDVTITSPTNGQVLKYNGTAWVNDTDANTGTVTSVGLSSATSGVTIGSSPITTSGTITLSIATASGSQNGLLSSTDWTTFNNKQSALTNPVTGTGTTNYLPKFTGTSTIGNSAVYQSGDYIGIGTIAPIISLQVRDSGNTYSGHFSGNDQTNGVAIGTLSSNVAIIQGYTRTFSAINDIVIQPSGGNLGLGVTPSAWSGSTGLQVQYATVEGRSSLPSFAEYAANSYSDAGVRKYIASDYASRYTQYQSNHYWLTAPSGTAGAAITFTQAMTLFANGNLAVGTTTDAGYKLDVNGTGRFSGNVNIGNAVAATNVRLNINGVVNKAGLIAFQESGVDKWLIGNGAASENGNLEIYNTNGQQALVFNKTTSAATFSSSVTAASYLGVLKDGSDTIGAGAYLVLAASTSSRQWIQQLSASQNLTYYHYNGSAWIQPVTFTAGGNVGIGTSSPAATLQVVGDVYVGSYHSANKLCLGADTNDFLQYSSSLDGILMASYGATAFYTGASSTERMRITSGGEVYIAGTTDQGAYNLQVNGTGVWGAGAYVNGSDLRLKENISDLDNSLELIKKMKPVTYNYKESYSKDNSTQTGFIAQDLKELLKNKKYIDGIVKQGNEYMSVAYQNIIPLLVKSIQEQQAQIEELKELIKNK